MAYRKIVYGTANQSNESDSHNRIQIANTGNAGTVFVVYVCLLITASILYMWIAHADLLQDLVASAFVGVFGFVWICAILFTRREISKTRTVITLNDADQQRALLEASIVAMTESYILYKDENGAFQFKGTTQITENRHFPAQIEAPKEQDATEAIITLYDKGSSGRAIERYLRDVVNKDKPKEQQVKYGRIQQVLDMYRPEWRERHKKVVDAEEYPVDE